METETIETVTKCTCGGLPELLVKNEGQFKRLILECPNCNHRVELRNAPQNSESGTYLYMLHELYKGWNFDVMKRSEVINARN